MHNRKITSQEANEVSAAALASTRLNELIDAVGARLGSSQGRIADVKLVTGKLLDHGIKRPELEKEVERFLTAVGDQYFNERTVEFFGTGGSLHDSKAPDFDEQLADFLDIVGCGELMDLLDHTH